MNCAILFGIALFAINAFFYDYNVRHGLRAWPSVIGMLGASVFLIVEVLQMLGVVS